MAFNLAEGIDQVLELIGLCFADLIKQFYFKVEFVLYSMKKGPHLCYIYTSYAAIVDELSVPQY